MAIFPKIDGTNICPGLNCEELGAIINQALVFFSKYAVGWDVGSLLKQWSNSVLLFSQLSFLTERRAVWENAFLWFIYN